MTLDCCAAKLKPTDGLKRGLPCWQWHALLELVRQRIFKCLLVSRCRPHGQRYWHEVGLSPDQKDLYSKNQKEVITGFLRKELQETNMKRCMCPHHGNFKRDPMMGTSEVVPIIG